MPLRRFFVIKRHVIPNEAFSKTFQALSRTVFQVGSVKGRGCVTVIYSI